MLQTLRHLPIETMSPNNRNFTPRHYEDSDDSDENEKNNILKRIVVLPIVVPVSLLFPVMSKGMMEQWKGFLVSHLRKSQINSILKIVQDACF
jgi:hypothetical protein